MPYRFNVFTGNLDYYESNIPAIITTQADYTALPNDSLYQDNYSGDHVLSYKNNAGSPFTVNLTASTTPPAPPGQTFLAPYTTDFNASVSTGVGTGTAYGTPGPAITGNKLDVTGAHAEGVKYTAVGNADFTQMGTIRGLYTPNYTGTPPEDFNLWFLRKPNDGSDGNNSIALYHNGTGQLHVDITSSSGSMIVSADLGAWSPVSGTVYEIELDMNITSGATRLFIDGVQFGSTQTGTGTRTSPASLLIFVGGLEAGFHTNYFINNFRVFTGVVHTANYTPTG